jgi:hypothetical protein
VNYDALVEMNAQFDFYNGGGLNCTFLGMGQVGQNGNVNVSRLSKNKLTGPGGFMDIVQNTRKVVFMGSFSKKDGLIKTFQQTCGFETTFDGPRALLAGQEVLYVSEKAVFSLNYRGLKIKEIAPGLDLKKDILDQMDFVPHGVETVKTMDPRIFDLSLPVGLQDKFFSVEAIVRDRVDHFVQDNVFLVDLSNLSLLTQDIIDDFIEVVATRCNNLIMLTDPAMIPSNKPLTFLVKLDGMRVPFPLQAKARESFVQGMKTRFEKQQPNVVFWNARDRLREKQFNNESKENFQYLWKDWAGLGRTKMSRTGLRQVLERALKIRVTPEHLRELMAGKPVIAEDDFEGLVDRIQKKVFW